MLLTNVSQKQTARGKAFLKVDVLKVKTKYLKNV